MKSENVVPTVMYLLRMKNISHFSKKKVNGNNFFNGIYTRKNSNSLTINNNNFQDRLEISSLNSKALTGIFFITIGDDEAETISWKRCSTRR